MEQQKIVSIMHADRIRDLQKDLGWTQLAYQTLQADSQKISDKLLLLLPAPQERKEKQWFEFWK